MDLIDKAIFLSSRFLSMKRRTKVVKNYHLLRRGELVGNRENYFRHWKTQAPSVSLPRLSDGYAIDKTRALSHLDKVIADAKSIVAENRNVAAKGKDYLINHLTNDDLSRHSSFLDFATSDEMVAIAGQYLGMMPVLSVIELWKSDRGDVPEIGSQLFHLDNADSKQVKVFIYLHDVDPDTGPFAFLPSSISKRVCDALEYGKVAGVERLTDEQVYSIASPEDLIICAYGEGAVLFVDTISCLHYGSRRNVKPRYLLMLQYLSPCRADFRKPSLKQHMRADDSDARKYLLDIDYRCEIEH